MSGLLHAAALAVGIVPVLCAVLAPPGARVRELALAAAMLAAMLDVVLGIGLLSPVAWAAVLAIGAIASMIGARRRSAAARAMRTADALGAVLMAALLPTMSAGAHLTAPAGTHAHGAGLPALVAVLGAAAIVHLVGCLTLARAMTREPGHRRASLSRAGGQVAMSVSTLLMAGAVALA